MTFLTQANFPRLWLFFQNHIGGTKDKQVLALSARENRCKILEIGCSVGNIADAFRPLKNILYTGIDIDSSAIGTAHMRFTKTQFCFLETSVEEHAKSGMRYDYILIAGMLHHVDDATALSILKNTRLLAGQNTIVNIFDPTRLLAPILRTCTGFTSLNRGNTCGVSLC